MPRSIRVCRVVRETRGCWLPLAAAVLCLLTASWGVPPFVAYVLIMASFGFCFDAATAWLPRGRVRPRAGVARAPGRHRRCARLQAVGRAPGRPRDARRSGGLALDGARGEARH